MKNRIKEVTSCGCEDITQLHTMINELIKSDTYKNMYCLKVQVIACKIPDIGTLMKDYYTAFLSFTDFCA
jgi:hypothetical protein